MRQNNELNFIETKAKKIKNLVVVYHTTLLMFKSYLNKCHTTRNICNLMYLLFHFGDKIHLKP